HLPPSPPRRGSAGGAAPPEALGGKAARSAAPPHGPAPTGRHAGPRLRRATDGAHRRQARAPIPRRLPRTRRQRSRYAQARQAPAASACCARRQAHRCRTDRKASWQAYGNDSFVPIMFPRARIGNPPPQQRNESSRRPVAITKGAILMKYQQGDPDELKTKFWKALADSPFLFLQLDSDTTSAVPMSAQLDKDANSAIWFFTHKQGKFAALGAATATFESKGHDIYARFHGSLTVETSRERFDQFWNNFAEAWFDGGK